MKFDDIWYVATFTNITMLNLSKDGQLKILILSIEFCAQYFYCMVWGHSRGRLFFTDQW